MRSKFKDEHPFEKRKAEAERIRQKYADRIPVICEKVEKSDIATIDKKKYLVPADLTVGQFVYVIRKRIKLSPEKAIFIFVDEVLPPTAALMSSIYEEHKDEDGFLYITVSREIILDPATASLSFHEHADFVNLERIITVQLLCQNYHYHLRSKGGLDTLSRAQILPNLSVTYQHLSQTMHHHLILIVPPRNQEALGKAPWLMLVAQHRALLAVDIDWAP
ncbi:hypothetical protein EPUS_06297 [Endocarpon pusillum Z07020]|uniref:Autophagy-related protein n=1 Tax=Endocarpon pusillum (strain Z07020 / HMAS-L-300199) TaxID=1263415 RepID=U1I4N2_ENDPU|nr:uncharacterized protein EPUS_06297 [Endocarpon pusillum Z07020]ERF77079.1 hypothetical protein EPUS_06297 [Endocarpon pusillum Z07020]